MPAIQIEPGNVQSAVAWAALILNVFQVPGLVLLPDAFRIAGMARSYETLNRLLLGTSALQPYARSWRA